jgi:perosamine synthetase
VSAALQKGAALPCDMERLVEVGRRHGVAVIEVAACATGSETLWNGQWQKIGKPHGDVSCFSFHPLKLVSTGDGGMLTTQNPEWDAQFRLLRQHATMTSADVLSVAHALGEACLQ